MRTNTETRIRKLVDFLPDSIISYLINRDLVNIFYHMVSDSIVPHIDHLYPSIDTETFSNTIKFLNSRFTPVGYPEIHENILGKKDFPRRSFHISFDDGFRECFTVARPILLENQVNCTFFITTDWINNQKMFYRNLESLCIHKYLQMESEGQNHFLNKLNMSIQEPVKDDDDFIFFVKGIRDPENRDLQVIAALLEIDIDRYLKKVQPFLTEEQIQALSREGFTIGAHSRTHRKFMDLPQEEVIDEIIGSCDDIRQITGQQVVPFSFPHSGAGVDRRLLYEIRKNNPWIGLFFDTKDFQKDVDIVVSRIWAERPSLGKKVYSMEEIIEEVKHNQLTANIYGWGLTFREMLRVRKKT